MKKQLIRVTCWVLVSVVYVTVAWGQSPDASQPLVPNADGLGEMPVSGDAPAKTTPAPAAPTISVSDVLYVGGKTAVDSYLNNDQVQSGTNNAAASLLNKLSNSGLSRGAQKALTKTPIVDIAKSAYELYQGKTKEAGHTFVKGWVGQAGTAVAAAGLTALGTTGLVPTGIAIAVGTGAKSIYDFGRENYGTGDPAKVEAFENTHKAWDMVRESGGGMTHEEALEILNAGPDETGEVAAQKWEEHERRRKEKKLQREQARDSARKSGRPTRPPAGRPSRPGGCTCPR